MRRILIYLLIAFCTFSTFDQELSGAHIVGGDVTYSFVRFNSDTTQVTFSINFTIYRDKLSNGANFDPAGDTSFGIFRKNEFGSWVLYKNVRNIGPGVPSDVVVNDDPCVEEPVDQVAVEQASYIFEETFEIGDTDYMVAYQRCCRNETIGNIIDPGEAGAAFDVIISPEAQISGNNSPMFNSLPPVFICAGYPITNVNQSATDAEGDVLKYSFCAPFSAGGTADANGNATVAAGCCNCVRPSPAGCLPDFANVVFKAPFTPTAPLAGNPVVTIDSNTGVISGVPETTGQYVVGVCVEEFRNGVSISKIRRDFQFNVLECERAVIAELDSDDKVPDPTIIGPNQGNTSLFIINACGDSTLTMKNISTDIRYIQNYDWEFYDENENVIFKQEGGAEARDAAVEFPGIGKYEGRMIVNKGIACSDTAPFTVNLYPAINADFDFEYDTCVAAPVMFMDSSTTGGDMLISWDWAFDDEGVSALPSPSFEFPMPGVKEVSLIVEDNNECKDTMTKQVQYYPAPATIVIEPSSFIGCTPSTITLNNLTAPIDSTYQINWNLGDGNTSNDLSPTHTYEESGVFSLSLEIISPLNCETTRDFTSWISIKDSPTADFDFDPKDPSIFNKTVNFTDLSTDGGGWQWEFGSVGNSFVQNPTFTFPDTGLYRVILTTFHPVTNCPDTISQFIDVIPTVGFFFPNAFTPNFDASNDEFIGQGYTGGLVDFNLSIFNRWGQRVFKTEDPSEGWNGQEYNNGAASPQGVYVYKASFKDPRGKEVLLDGNITLLR